MSDSDLTATEESITRTLAAADSTLGGNDTGTGGGDDTVGGAAEELLPLVYELLRERARRMMPHERADHTLSATALVHEAYARVASRPHGFQGRRHFYNAAAQAMRRILVEHARAHRSAKRGGGAPKLDVDAVQVPAAGAGSPVDWLALDEAMGELAKQDPRRHQVVMLRYFAGLGEAEVAELMEVDVRTVRRDWSAARLWLYSRLSDRRR